MSEDSYVAAASSTVTTKATPPESQVPVEASPETPRRRRRRFSLGLDRFSGVYVLALIIIIFGFWVPNTFLTTLNLRTILAAQAITALVSLGLLLPMAAGNFDLSVGATLGTSLMLVLKLQNIGMNALLASVIAILSGAVIGLVNGIVVVAFNVDSFIATLGMSSILSAVTVAISGGQQIATGISPTFLKLASTQWFGINAPVYYTLGVAILLWAFLEYRPGGRAIYATGGNPRAARLAGIRVGRVVASTLVASGAISAFAGVLLASTLGAGTPTVGPPYLLPAFTAVFLGATQIKRGRVNVVGTILAIFLLATGVKGLQLAGAPIYLPDLFNGLALLLAVALAVRSRRAR